jgi:DNA primase
LREKIVDARGTDSLENLLGAGHVAITPCVRRPGDIEMAMMAISEELAKLEAEQGLSAEVAEAAEDLVGLADESVTWRLGQAAQARNLAMRSEHEDKAEYDTAPNGARISRDEKSAFDALLGKLNVTKEP